MQIIVIPLTKQKFAIYTKKEDVCFFCLGDFKDCDYN